MPENELIELTRDTTPATRGKALETLGVRYASRSDYRTAKTFLEQAVVVNDQAGDLEWSSTSRQILGRVLFELGTDAGFGDSFSHAATATGVAIMVSNSTGVKRPRAA